jgi:hypothetical protein
VLFRTGDPVDLAAKLRWAAAEPAAVLPLGRNARSTFESELSAGPAYERLMAAYDQARTRVAGPAG